MATLALLALPACHDDDDDDDTQVLSAALGGPSSSRAEFVIAPDGSNVAVSTTTSDVRSAQIRSGTAASGGPVLFTVSSVPAVLGPADLQPQGDIDTFEEAVDLLREGGAFVSVRSPEFSGGEGRGQIGPAAFRSTLRNGATELGTAIFIFDPEQTRINFSMDTSSLGFPPTSATLQPAGGGPSFFALPGTTSGTLTSADLRPQPAAGITTFDDALQAIMSGRTTLQVGTFVTPSAAGGPLVPSPPVSTPSNVAVPLPTGVPPTASPFTPAPAVPTTPDVPSPSGIPPAPSTPATPTPGFAPTPVFTPSFTPEPRFPGVTPPSSTPSTAVPQPSATPTTPAESPFVPRPAPPPPNTFSPATRTP